VGADSRVTGSYTCTSLETYDLQTRMQAAAAGQWYKIVSVVNGHTMATNGSEDGQNGATYISALAVSDCVDGTKDLVDCNKTTTCTDWSTTDTWLRNWAGASGKSALPYLATDASMAQTANDYWDACTQNNGQDTPLGSTNSFYLNRKVSDDGDRNYSYGAACDYNGDGEDWELDGRWLGAYTCAYQNHLSTSYVRDILGFRVVVRPPNLSASIKSISDALNRIAEQIKNLKK
jgi:hypothetical protein